VSYDTDSTSREPAPSAAGLAPDDRLFVPHRKRLSHDYVVNDDGVRELRIYYGLKDITFDEPRLFAFGERLVTAASFTGREAMAWGPDYAWDEVGPLLEALLADGILVRRRRQPRSARRRAGRVAAAAVGVPGRADVVADDL
jgi:hypothetical protein